MCSQFFTLSCTRIQIHTRERCSTRTMCKYSRNDERLCRPRLKRLVGSIFNRGTYFFHFRYISLDFMRSYSSENELLSAILYLMLLIDLTG